MSAKRRSTCPPGLTVSAKGRAFDIYPCFDSCCEKMEKQLRRYKRRLKDHHRERAHPVELSDAGSYILARTDEDDSAEADAKPIIIAEMQAKIPSLSVSEAVMQMELAHSSVLVFRNEKNNGINVVYQRDDGNVGWIEPT